MAALSKPNAQYTDGGISVPCFDVPAKTVPASSTAEVSVDCRLRHLSIRNPNGGTTRTFTVTDGSGNLLYSGNLAANGIFEVDKARPGQLLSGGIKWQTSGGTDLIGDMLLEMSNPA